MSDVLHPALTVRQVAAYLSVNEKTVYRLAQRGELPGFKVAGAWRFQRDDLAIWISARKEAVRQPVSRNPKAAKRAAMAGSAVIGSDQTGATR